MSVLAYDESVRRQIRTLVENANLNIYGMDDLLDMMNRQIAIPGEKPKHLVLVPIGRWICYYLVDHPNKGRCHYFHIMPDITGEIPNRSQMEYIVKEFGIDRSLLDEHIQINKDEMVVNVILPFGSQDTVHKIQ